MSKIVQVATVVFAGCLLGGCEPHVNNSLGGPVEIVPNSARVYIPAPTEAAARAAVARRLRPRPVNAPDSIQAYDAGSSWQVEVLRRDSAGPRPIVMHFEVDKATGDVRHLGPRR